MSRSSRKSHTRKTRKILGISAPVLPWIIGGLVLLPIIGALLLSQPSGGSIDPNFVPKVKGAPSLQVAQNFFELGDQHYNIPVDVTYSLQNVGDKPLRILEVPKVRVLEGCCPPTPTVSSMTLQPGQYGTIAISFAMHAGMDGPHDYRIALKTDDPAQPVTELRVTSNWIP